MRAATLRRMIVFGVCAVGVGCLYLAPSIARSPDQVTLPPLSDEPTAAPSSATGDGTPRPAATGVTRDVTAPTGVGQTSGPGGDEQSNQSSPDQTRPVRGATAYDPNDTHDSEPPTAVDVIKSATVTPRRLGLTWDAASDNVGVVGYRIWVNGFAVATTAETHAKVRWFNDDSGKHVVQIRAIDAEGNESTTSPTLVITRPSTGPTPKPTPDPTESAQPTPEPSATTEPEPTSDPTSNAHAATPTPSASASPTE